MHPEVCKFNLTKLTSTISISIFEAIPNKILIMDKLPQEIKDILLAIDKQVKDEELFDKLVKPYLDKSNKMLRLTCQYMGEDMRKFNNIEIAILALTCVGLIAILWLISLVYAMPKPETKQIRSKA